MASQKSSPAEPGKGQEQGKEFRAKFNCAAFFLLFLVAFGFGLFSPWGFLVPVGMIGMAVSLGVLAYYYL